MKLKVLIPETIDRINKYINIEKFKIFLEEGKINHWYISNFDKWAVSMCKTAIYTPEEICNMYETYRCNDTHIYTLIHYCMKKLNII